MLIRLTPNDRASATIVYPARSGTGLRHAITFANSHTWCGIPADDWFMEHKKFNAKTIGCLRCKAIWARPNE